LFFCVAARENVTVRGSLPDRDSGTDCMSLGTLCLFHLPTNVFKSRFARLDKTGCTKYIFY